MRSTLPWLAIVLGLGLLAQGPVTPLVMAQNKVDPKKKEPPTVEAKEIAVPQGLNDKAYKAWVADLAKKYNGKVVRLVGTVETVVEEPAKRRIQVPLRLEFDDNGKKNSVRVVGIFPLTKDAEVKKYIPTDMNRNKFTILVEGKAIVQSIGSTEPFSLAECKVVEVK